MFIRPEGLCMMISEWKASGLIYLVGGATGQLFYLAVFRERGGGGESHTSLMPFSGAKESEAERPTRLVHLSYSIF